MVNFGPLAAEIVSLVWGTKGNFNGFRVLAALLHGTLVVDVSQTAALNRGRHLYSAGRPLRWALAHILVWLILFYNESYKNRIVERRIAVVLASNNCSSADMFLFTPISDVMSIFSKRFLS